MYSYACFSSDGRLYCSVLYVKIVRLHFTSFAMLPSWHNNRIFQVSLTFNVLTWSMRAFFASNRCHHVKFSFWVQYNKASFSTNCNVYLNGCLHRYSALANSPMSAYSIMQHSPGYYIPLRRFAFRATHFQGSLYDPRVSSSQFYLFRNSHRYYVSYEQFRCNYYVHIIRNAVKMITFNC